MESDVGTVFFRCRTGSVRKSWESSWEPSRDGGRRLPVLPVLIRGGVGLRALLDVGDGVGVRRRDRVD